VRSRLAIPKLVAPLAVAVLALGACSGYGDDSSDDAGEAASATGQAASAALVGTGSTPLGDVLTTAEGKTLYGLTEDQGGSPTCAGDCASTWPPVLVDSAELPEGLDPEVYSVVQRDDGAYQLAAGGWPLYSFAADTEPGDVEGQGSGGVWYAVAPGGQLLRDAGSGSGQSPEPEQAPEDGSDAEDGSDIDAGSDVEATEPEQAPEQAPESDSDDGGADDGGGSSGGYDYGSGDGYGDGGGESSGYGY
jgi:predicted lipoprotein with Yx(FWY)xxD motif